jgi:hypothetical protein
LSALVDFLVHSVEDLSICEGIYVLEQMVIDDEICLRTSHARRTGSNWPLG